MSEARDTRGARLPAAAPAQEPGLGVVLREWGRIGCIGFGGPPAHIALLRDLCVERRRWLSDREFEDAIAATNLLPGPASTQLAIYCAWRLGGVPGALVGGLSFRNDIVKGPGGQQILLDDPAGNPIELFQPAAGA